VKLRPLLLAGLLLVPVPAMGTDPGPPVLSDLSLAVLSPVVRPILEEAYAAEGRGELERAASRYRLVIHKDSTVVPAVLGLARVLEAAGDLEGADKALASLAHEAEVVFARAWLLEERDPETALQLYARLETLALGHSEPYLRQALLLAESDPVEAREKLDVWWEMEGGVPHEDAVLAVALGLKADGELEGALELLDSRKQAWPDGEEPEALAGLRDRIGVEREALRLAAGGMVPLTSVQAAALARARKVFNRGGNERALEALRELLGEAPRNAELWATIGDVHRSRGAVEEAERAYVAATTLAPEEARYHANLGTLLAERYGGRRHREAIAELGAALAQKSSWAEIHFRLANVQCEAGRFEDAAESLRAYLTLEPGGAHATEASELLEDLERTRPVTAVLPASPELDSDVPDPARLVYRVARVYRGRGEKERARVEAMKALELAPSYLDALMLLAAMDLEDGDQVSAAQRYRRCFELAPHDPGLLLTLGDLERAAGQVEAAQRYFRGAAEAGAPEAFYRLADMAAERGDLREARRLIDSYFEVSTGGLAHEPALALQARVQRQLRLVRWGVGGGLALVFALAGAWLLRRRTGSSLQVLLARKPASYHEVARLLSAIRHEVLKHNTNLLASVADRLEDGDTQAALYAAERLYGEGDEVGVIRRFEGYIDELEAVGRPELRLNLRVRDPVLAPMHRAMRRLKGLERSLRRPHRASGRLPDQLRLLSRQLNDEGYTAIGRLIQDVSVQRVDLPLLEAVYRRVAEEPSLEGQAPPVLEIEGQDLSVPVRIFRKDFEDVAANLLRNAVFALIEELPLGERRVGLALVEEMDPVTGLETLALRFRDNAPRPLTDAILRGRRIEQGLGLAADLLARHQGVMNVETGASERRGGWTKAVVVRLPRAELAYEEEQT
jgi:tetratricopeptide (TPR) repeat protein